MAEANAKTADNGGQTSDQAAPADPFANLPTVTLGETGNVPDYTGIATAPERKYAKVADEARNAKSPMQVGWKHERAIFVPGTNKRELKAGSVHGTVQAIVNKAGRAGISAIELVCQLRQAQIGNKRSIYCTELPPVGWAEGWINSAVTRNIVGVHATRQASPLRAEPKPEAATGTDG